MSVWEQGLGAPITNAVRLTIATPGTGGHDSAAWRPHDPTTFLYVNYYQNSVTLPGGEGVIEVAGVPTGPWGSPVGCLRALSAFRTRTGRIWVSSRLIGRLPPWNTLRASG